MVECQHMAGIAHPDIIKCNIKLCVHTRYIFLLTMSRVEPGRAVAVELASGYDRNK